jgi:hypothetical protein
MAHAKSAAILGLGSIVSFRAYHLHNVDDPEVIYLSGDPNLVSPLMVVCEVWKSGLVKEKDPMIQYKCAWFSHRDQLFKSAWIQESLLVEVAETPQRMNNTIALDKLVRFTTTSIELKKRKVSFSSSDSSNGKRTVTPQLIFSGPVMQISDVVDYIPKEPPTNKAGEVIRIVPSKLVKCKYFNADSDKIVEVNLPFEVLEVLPDVSKTIGKIKQAILYGAFLVCKGTDKSVSRILLKPERIYSLAGTFLINGYDYLTSKWIRIAAEQIDIVRSIEQPYSMVLPEFDFSKDKLVIAPITRRTTRKLITKVGSKKYLQIKYISRTQVLTTRTIKDYSLLEDVRDLDQDGTYNRVDYIKAHCCLRNDTRYFRLDRIQQILVLNI